MATPTPSTKTAHNAATPQSQPHLAAFSSPVPRSVPSPAAQRVQAGKSPFNASTHAPTNASTATAMNHPTGGSTGSAARALLGSSPAPAMLNLESPLPGLTPSFSNMANLFSSVEMGFTGSGLSGLGGMSMNRPPTEEERKARLESVVAIIKQRPGRISVEGVKRLCELCGFETNLMSTKRGAATECSLAGNHFILTIEFDTRQRVSDVQVSLSSPSTVLQDFSISASKIVFNSLSIPKHLTTLTATLDSFARNLDKLALLDKPNGGDKLHGGPPEPPFDGYEAIAGIYTSLRKLYEHEKKVAVGLLGFGRDVERKAEVEVTCKKSGRPMMNARNEIGLQLDYWIHRGCAPSNEAPSQRDTDADGDRDMDGDKQQEASPEDGSEVFALSIECQGAESGMYSPARISDAWISDQVERQADDPVIDWLDPPPTYQTNPNGEHSNSLGPDGSLGKLPNVRFVAKLQPPLVLPWEAMVQLLGAVGVPQQTVINQCETYFDAALLQPTSQDAARITIQSAATQKDIKATKKVLVAGGGESEGLREHVNSLFIPKRDHGGVLNEIPFEHPKQLVMMLPYLRQYACLNTFLKASFMETPSLSPASTENALENWSVDMTLSTFPSPRLAVVFPRAGSVPAPSSIIDTSAQGFLSRLLSNGASTEQSTMNSSSASVTFDILSNAEISIVDQNLVTDNSALTDDTAKEQESERQKIAISKLSRALVVSGNIDIWTEWASKWNGGSS
ncbi:putative mediator complex subunit med1 protein [Venturia nashicola]|nr:putative mediator complex subunit med1 protein [Venturia nashicola]